MSRNSHYAKPRQKKAIKIIIWILVFAVAAGAVVFFVTNYYEDTKRKLNESNYPQKYSEYVDKAAKEYNLEPSLIYSVIRTESNFDPEAKSDAGACGIMQMMPSSFEWLQTKRGCEGKYTEKDLFNPSVCIDYGCYLLKYFYDLYGTEKSAVAAYNAGFVVGDWLENDKYSSDGKNLSDIPYPETEKYVEKVESSKQMYINLYYS